MTEPHPLPGGSALSGWLATVSLGIIWQISFSPYVSDYSRYLPADIGIAKPFWATYLGATLGTILSFTFGAVAVLATPEGTEAMVAVKQSTGWLGPILMVLFLLNIISHNALNLYGAVLSIITSIQTFASQWTPSIKVRVVLSSVVLAGCCVVALGASADFISEFIGLILALLLVLVPMLAKQLVRLYELAPQMLDWLQHTAMPWAQAKLGLADGFWKFDKVKAAISEHMGQTTDIVGVVLSQATASGLALIGWLANLVLMFYVGVAFFIFVVLGAVCRISGFSLWRFLKYIKDEIFIVLGTASSESALPRLLQKLEKFGCSKQSVGLVLPTGYAFNLDGTSIYMSLCVLFIANAYGVPMSWEQQLGTIAIMLVTSKGAAGVTGSGFIVLAATLASVGSVPVAGIALILGIDRFMSEARALTNLIGNGVATLVVAKWCGELNTDTLNRELAQGPAATPAVISNTETQHA